MFHSKQTCCVFVVHATTVLDVQCVCNFLTVDFRKYTAAECDGVVGLFVGCCYACADSPNWFVCNDNVSKLFCCDTLETFHNLTTKNLFHVATFAFSKSFANANDWFKTSRKCRICASKNCCISFAKVSTAFAVTNYNIFYAKFHQHRRSNFPCESATFLPMAVLCTNVDVCALCKFYCCCQICERNADDNCVVCVCYKWNQRTDQSFCFGDSFVHFPVACDDFVFHSNTPLTQDTAYLTYAVLS